MMDINQQVVFFWCRHKFSPNQRLVAHDVEGTAKAVMDIVVEVDFRHLTTHDSQCLAIVDILPRLAVFVDEKTDTQFLPNLKDSLQSSLKAVGIDVVGQRYDARDVILHHLREFHAVVKDAQL